MTLTSEIFGAIPLPATEDAHEERVRACVAAERARREARRRVDAEERGATSPPAIETLKDRLARPRQATPYRVEGLQPKDARVMLAAQFKAGKTTVVGNLIRSLVDGDPFLGRYTVHPIDGTVVLFDLEMGESQLDDWLRDQGIRNTDRVIVIPLRGKAASFNLLDEPIRAEWVQRVRHHRGAYGIIDCVRPLMDALGLDEHRDAGRLLVAVDAFLLESGMAEALLVQHMGHTGERSRGDSRLRDWPDVEWRLVRENDEPSSARFISAYGRDVDVPESQLEFDARTRRLTIAGGSRKGAEASSVLQTIIEVLPDLSSPSAHAIWRALRETEIPRATIEAALKLGKQNGTLTAEKGPKNATLYSSSPVPRSSPSVPRGTGEVQFPSSPPLYKGGKLGNSVGGDPDANRY